MIIDREDTTDIRRTKILTYDADYFSGEEGVNCKSKVHVALYDYVPNKKPFYQFAKQ